MTRKQIHIESLQFCFLFVLVILCLSCNGQKDGMQIKAAANTENDTETQVTLDNNIRSIYQDQKGTYWFGTNAAGIFRYDGKKLIQYTVNNGLSNNQVQSIQEDQAGNIWLSTGLYSVSKFDGQTFTTHNIPDKTNSNLTALSAKTDSHVLWFYAGSGAFFYDDKLLYLPLDEAKNNTQNSPYKLSQYAVYSIFKDSKGHIWFGTQSQGVCCFNGKVFKWFTEKGLAGSAVLAIFEDRHGNMWFGNNGAGLFKYNGTSLVNFTEEKALTNLEFKTTGKSAPGTLARIYAINEDPEGNLWIGTVDAGVWKYDGETLTNFTSNNGLTSYAVNCIYKDRQNKLWFGTDQDGIFTFNGKSFDKFEIK